jgi:hypothetical protein
MSDPDLELLVDELVLQEDQDSADLELTTFITEVVFTEEVLQLELTGDTLQLEVGPELLQLEVAAGLPGPPGPASEDDMPYDLQVDTTSPTVTYIGQAQPGTATSAAAWRIKRLTESETGLAMDWAGGTAGFVHSWDDRLALSYGP